MKKHVPTPPSERTIAVVFYRFRREIKTLKFIHLDNACQRCFGCVESNKYEATTAEVVDLVTGFVYLTIYISVDGNIFGIYGKGAKDKIKLNKKIMIPLHEDEV